MTERLKLKRGLADISPLFEREEVIRPVMRIAEPIRIAAPARKPATPEVCFIWSEDDESDAHFLNNFFASKMVAPDSSALLMSFEDHAEIALKEKGPETWNRSLRRIRLPVLRIKEAFKDPEWESPMNEKKTGSQIFLEMRIENLFSCADLVRALDHVVFFLKPQVDSVTETYRKLKYLTGLGLRADVTVLFDADDAGGLPSRLYELFSDFVSRRLSLSMNYLGTLHLSRGAEGLRQDIRWDSWSATRVSRTESIEKMHFLSWVEKLNREEALR